MRVYLIGSTQLEPDFARFYEENYLTQYSTMPDPLPSVADQLVETAGRLCYLSYGKGRNSTHDHVGHLLAVGHGSVLEHANFTFLIQGVSRSLTHELVRHRHFSFSQMSQRYVDESEAEFIVPPALEGKQDLIDVARRAWDTARTAYKIIADNLSQDRPEIGTTGGRKQAREAARSVLPNATETKIVVTGNARAWRHFLATRGSAAADAEMRGLAVVIFSLLQAKAPAIFQDVRIEGGEVVVEYVT
jgi:thymidylate synthase (FAD)